MPDSQIKKQRFPDSLFEVMHSWLAMITKSDEDEYNSLLAQTGIPGMLLGVLLSAVMSGLYTCCIGSMPAFITALPASIHFWMMLLLFILVFFAANLIIFIAIKFFHGSGGFIEQCTLLSLLVTPAVIIILLLLSLNQFANLDWNAILSPYHLSGLAGVVLILLSLYGILLLMLAIRAVHQVKAYEAMMSLLVLAGIWAISAIVNMFTTHQDTLITRIWTFVLQQWQGGYLQEALLGHFWLVLFSVLIATIIGIITGVLITMPVHSPKTIHLLFLLPLIIFFVIWAASSGLLSEELASQINQTVRTWDRSLRSHDGFWSELLVIVGAIIRKPEAIGLIGIALILMFYFLLLVGEKASELTLYLAGIILTIPSIALFGVLIKPLGIGVFNAAFALILYAQLPILRNTYTGIKEIQPEIIEAGKGMGMTEFQLLMDVKLPLAVPVIMTGLRVSTVMLVGIAAIAAYIGTNTLGDYIFAGIQRAQEIRYITGAIVVAILALVVDFLLGLLQEHLTPIEYKVRRNNR